MPSTIHSRETRHETFINIADLHVPRFCDNDGSVMIHFKYAQATLQSSVTLYSCLFFQICSLNSFLFIHGCKKMSGGVAVNRANCHVDDGDGDMQLPSLVK